MVEHIPNMHKILGFIPNNIENRMGEQKGRGKEGRGREGMERKKGGEGKEVIS